MIAGARAIATGDMSVVIAGGVESMSRAPFVLPKSDAPFSRGLVLEDTTLGWRFVNPEMRRLYGVDSMAETAENVAEAYQISREDQDRFAWQSQRRAMDGAVHHAEEIIPVQVAGRGGAATLVERDEHPRPDTTLEKLSRLAPIVRPSGTVTAGNASGINDGASALLLASEDAIVRHGLTPVARIVASAVAGVAPRLMGMGPVPATRKALERAGIREADLDVIELNEAFAAQAVAVLRELGVADDDPACQSQRRGDCHRSSARCERRAPHRNGGASTPAFRRALRAGNDVHRRRTRHRPDRRARVTWQEEKCSKILRCDEL